MTRKPPSSADGSSNKTLALLIGTTCGFVAAPNLSLAGPAGGVVTGGQGTISTPTATSTVIDQTSGRLSIDWQSFDVAANESVNFRQPSANSVALNRILDQKASEVFGRIEANGRVVLFNSNGILFGPGSQVNVGSLVATSLNVVSFDEATGQLRLSATGTPGAIVNNGAISAARGGSVSLVGGAVANNGLIVADLGSVNLAAGRAATIDLYGGGLLRFDADSALIENAGGTAAGVANTGEIRANGGQVLLTTSAVQSVFDRAVNNEGLVRANRIDNSGGTIRLVGPGGTVVNSGVLDASGTGAGSTGGNVQMLGENVGLFGDARVDVSGDAGGGTALIGGDYQGANPDVLNANQTIVGPDAQILADARIAGDGGRVILWSEEGTRFHGGIAARGGAVSGNGGFAEVSSHGVLGFSGSVKVGAAAGQGGQLLLDPDDITIAAAGGNATPNLDFDDPPVNAIVEAGAIEDALRDNGTVSLRAADDITVNAAIDVSGDASANGRGIALEAGDDIAINANISTRNGGIVLTAASTSPDADPDTASGGVTFAAAVELNSGTAGITISSEDSLALGTLSGGPITVTSSAGSITNAGATLTGTSLTVTAGTSIDLDTSVGTLTQASAATALTIANTGNLVLTNAAAADVDISSTGNLQVGMVNAADTATLTSVNAAIVDDGAVTAISAGNEINLAAQSAIGAITPAQLISGAAGTPVSVNTAGTLTASVTAPAGQINLNLAQIPTIDAGGIDLGGAVAATGTILLQTQAGIDFDASPGGSGIAAGAIDLEAGNSAAVGLRAGGTLTLPANANSLFDAAPATLAVGGTSVVDDDGAGLSFAVGHLVFDSDTTSVLNTDIDRLTATIGNNQSLTVIEADDLELNSVNVGIGAMNLDVNGALTDGAGATPSVVAAQLVITDADSVVLDTNVNMVNASGVTNALTISEASGPLLVANATSAGAVNISTVAGALNVTNASGAGGVTLAANGVGGTLQVTNVNGGAGGVALTSNGAMTLGAVTTIGAPGVTLTANGGGAITDGVGVSVTANQLTIAAAGSADLNTNVSTLTANNVGAGGLTITQMGGPLSVANATSIGGAVAISTLNSDLTIGNAAGNGLTFNAGSAGGSGDAIVTGNLTVTGIAVATGTSQATLIADGAITLDTVNASPSATVTLQARDGAISDEFGATPSIVAGQLTITDADSVALDTNVSTLNASGVSGALTVRERVGGLQVANASASGLVDVSTDDGPLTVTNAAGAGVVLAAGGAGSDLAVINANAGPGAAVLTAGRNLTIGTVNASGTATLTATNGAILDDDAGTAATTGITAGAVALTAATSIGTVTDFATAAGLSVDVNTAGSLTAVTTTNSPGSAINLNISGAPLVAQDGIVLGPQVASNRTGSVLLQSANALNLANLDSQAINIGASNTVNVGYVSGGLLTLPAGGSPTDTLPFNLLVSGADIQQNGAPIGTISLSANTLHFNASAPANAFQLNTDVDTLNANVAGGALNVDEFTGDITLGDIVAQSLTVQADTPTGAILDDGDDSTVVTAQSIALGSTGAVGSVAGLGAIDVDTADLAVFAGTGDVAINSVGATPIRVALTAGNAAPGAGNGNVSLIADGEVRVAQLVADQDVVNVTSTGQIINDVAIPVVTADQLVIGGASGVDLGVDINTLIAGGVSGNLNVIETNGALQVANATAGGNVNVSNISGAMTVANATGTNVTLGTATDLTLGAVSAADTVSLLAGGAIADAPDAIASVAADQLTITGASLVDLDTNVNVLDATGLGGTLLIREQSGDLQVANANSTAGQVYVTSVTGALTDVNAAGLGVTLTAATNLSLDDVNAGPGIVALTAGGAITDAAGATPSVTTNQLLIANSGSVDLDTNINVLDATNVAGNLAVREQSGDLVVGNAHSTAGTVNVSTVAGALTVTNTTGAGITLAAGGDLTLGTVNAGGGAVSLAATGSIGDAADATPSVVAQLLEITAAGSADLDTDVNFLQASGVTGGLSVREQTGALAVIDASAAGAVNVSTVDGALQVANAAGNGITLTANGSGSDLNANGAVDAGSGTATLTAGRALIAGNVSAGSATLTSNGAMTLGTVNANLPGGTVSLAAGSGAITDGAGATPSVVADQITILSAGSANLDTNVNTLDAGGVGGTLTIREQTGSLAVANASASGAVNVSTVAGALTNVSASGSNVTLSAGGAGSGLSLATVNAGAGTATLAAGGAISDAAGATPSVLAGQLTITQASSADLDTDVNILDASGVTGSLGIREQTGDLLVSDATAGSVNVAALAGGLDVGNAAGNGVTLSANTGLTLGTVNSGAGTTTLEAGGAITDAADETPSVVGNQLTITGAGMVDLDTNVNVLDANGVSGALSVREQAGNLAVTNANAGGAVHVSTVDGDLDVAEAHSNDALHLTAGGTGALTIASSTASGTGAVLTSGGDMTLGTLNTTLGPTVLNSGGALTLGTINAAQGAVELTAGGAISDAAGASPSVMASQLTIGGATSVDLDTNVDALVANNVTGDLAIREQAGSLAVASANATGAVDVSTVAGALTGVNASGSSVTLNAGGAGSGLTLVAVNSGTGTASLSAGGAISDGAGAAASVVAGQLDITGAGSVDLDTNVDTLNAGGVNGALSIREQTGNLAVANATVGGALNLSTVAGALEVANATGNGVTLNAGSDLTLGTVSAGGGAASLTAGGAITDGTTGTALTAGNVSITAGSIGAADNVLDTAIGVLTASTTSGSLYIREADSVSLANVTVATGEDIVVGAFGDITVGTIANADGRVLLAAGNNILADGSVNGPHITARDAELRAGGLDSSGGSIGTNGSLLRMNVPQTIAGAGGAPIPSVLLLQNQSAADPTTPANPNQIATVGDIQISVATFDAGQQDAASFLTTTFSTRTAQNEGVLVANADFFGQPGPGGAGGAVAVNTLAAANANAASTNAAAAGAQGEGTLYIDWASFDPNVSLFGTVNPPICLPGDQAEEDPEAGDAGATASGCASTTARYDGSFRLPEVKLVITSRGVEWVAVRSRDISVFPLIGQLR
jgi:filamentous hemagglutinin family protein